jgi:hypothetical protein
VAFSYQLLDAQGNQIAADDVELKANSIHRFPRHLLKHQSYAYEKYMIKQWFKKNLLTKIVKSD